MKTIHKMITTEVCESECNAARVIQVIETRFARGSGEADDPEREVTQYWSLDGELLAETENKGKYGAEYRSTPPMAPNELISFCFIILNS